MRISPEPALNPSHYVASINCALPAVHCPSAVSTYGFKESAFRIPPAIFNALCTQSKSRPLPQLHISELYPNRTLTVYTAVCAASRGTQHTTLQQILSCIARDSTTFRTACSRACVWAWLRTTSLAVGLHCMQEQKCS